MKAEFEDQPGLLLGCSNLVFNHPKTLIAIARAVDPATTIYGLVSSEAHARKLAALLESADLDSDRIHPLIVPTQSMWVRDFGPLFISDGGHTAIMDARYKLRPDDLVPSELATMWGLGAVQTPLWCEGGHLVYNGQGLLLISTMVARLNLLHEDIEGPEIIQLLQRSLPFDEAHWIEPMPEEPTGHLDMFMSCIAADRIVVARVDPAEDPELAQHLDATAERIAGFSEDSKPLEILRVDTPAPRDGIWYTYTNVILIGAQVLVPVYPELGDAPNERALRFWREALAGREVIGIDSSSIIQKRGALHCVSMPLPVLPEDLSD